MLTLAEQVRKVISDTLNVSLITMHDNSNLTTDFGRDESDVMELQMNLIDAFDIFITDEDFEPLSKGTVGGIIKYIRKRAEMG